MTGIFKTTGWAVTAAAMILFGGSSQAWADTILEYTGIVGLHGGNITAKITLDGTVAPNTIYTTDDFVSATITDTDPYWYWTRALGPHSYIQTDADGDVLYWNIHNHNSIEQNIGSYYCYNPDPHCGGATSGWWIGDGDPSAFVATQGTWACTADCLAESSTAPEPSSYSLLLIGAGVLLAGRQRFSTAFRTAHSRK